MKINIYYGGRGLIDDPTLYVINKVQEVLEELNVRVERYNLFELKNSITSLPQTLKEADGIILATTVEWLGIGGYMQMFLDACWLYGDKEKISTMYMCPVVMSTTYGEKEGRLHLDSAWEILGGKTCSGLCGYIKEISLLENNKDYTYLIEKKTENLYRTINQKIPSLPASNQTVVQTVSVRPNSDLTPQETEQLSQYAADDSYIQRSKADIQELVNFFNEKLEETDEAGGSEFVDTFKNHFKPQAGCKLVYQLQIEGKHKPLIIKVDAANLECYYGNVENTDVDLSMAKNVLEEIISGGQTFQRAFMSGEMKMKGDFRLLNILDQIFIFTEG